MCVEDVVAVFVVVGEVVGEVVVERWEEEEEVVVVEVQEGGCCGHCHREWCKGVVYGKMM